VTEVDGLNAGYARALLEQYLENPDAVPAEWRELFESGDSDLVASHPGLARLIERLRPAENCRPPPAETPPERIETAFLEVLEGLRNHSLDEALASLACHSAVRFGDPLEPSEQRRLIEELESTTPDATCPHGRPTRLVLDWQDLKRHFRRNY